jgi:hypothetical protein
MLLIVMLPVAIGIVSAPMRYSAPVATALTVAQLLLIGGAAYGLAGPAWRSGDENRRRIVVVAMLLILPWALLTLMPGYGPPFAATLAMNHSRYVILFVSATFMSAAFLMLKDALADAGERLLAPLGQAAGLLGTLVQLVWTAILIGWMITQAHKPATYLPVYGTLTENSSDVLLFFAGLLTYVATGCYALAFARAGWLGPIKATIVAVIATIAILGLAARGLGFPDLGEDWYMVPGDIVGIPAIPWLMPYLLGVAALRQAARD